MIKSLSWRAAAFFVGFEATFWSFGIDTLNAVENNLFRSVPLFTWQDTDLGILIQGSFNSVLHLFFSLSFLLLSLFLFAGFISTLITILQTRGEDAK